MPYAFRGRTLGKVGVVGSGQIGPDIALHFAKVMAPAGTPVIVVDVSAAALERGREKLEKKVGKGVETGAFKPAEGEAIRAGVTFTSDYAALQGADLVVEAATEDAALKGRIFAQLEATCAPDALLLSNSSHLPPEEIFAKLARPERSAVVHYFFPAERNRALEIVPWARSARASVEWLLGFYEEIGKIPLEVRSRYGYAVDPLFEGLLQTAALLVERGVATTKEVDTVACQALGLGIGPFTAHNLTGGNPITAHGLAELHRRVNPWFAPPRSLLELVEKKTEWETPGRGEKVVVAPEKARRISDALRATFWGLCAETVESGIISVADLELLAPVALVIGPPFAGMNAVGTREALRLVRALAAELPGFPVARNLVERGERGTPWETPSVLRQDREGVAVLTIRRPQVLNALDQGVFAELEAHAAALRADAAVKAVVLTGYGSKAFVSGADVGFLARIETPQEGIDTSLASQRPLAALAGLGKPVVCALNGLAFGGGLELAMACSYRLARQGLKTLAAQPEPNLGIIPGAGGTQRLPRLIGVERAAELLRTGRPISSAQAREWGLIDEEVEGARLLERAMEVARALAAGQLRARELPQGPLPAVPAALPAVELGHLSRAVDAIIVRAVLEGARRPLAEGLRLEAELFGEVAKLKDMRIGVETFLKEGPRAKAKFVHA